MTCAGPLEAWHVVGNGYMGTLVHTSPCPRGTPGDSGRGMSPSVESGGCSGGGQGRRTRGDSVGAPRRKEKRRKGFTVEVMWWTWVLQS